MAFTARQRWMINASHLGMLRQPLGHFQTAFMMLTQAYTERAQPAAGHIGGIGIHHLSHQIRIFTQLIPTAGVGHRRADHAVRVADKVFCGSLNGDIDVKIQRFEQHTRRPGVIDHDNGVRSDATHGANNRRNVMHFHGDGTG
ncbi:hypothetical protein D3C80_1659820 [compost metagenome]